MWGRSWELMPTTRRSPGRDNHCPSRPRISLLRRGHREDAQSGAQRGHSQAEAGAATWQREPPPVLPFLGTKSAESSQPGWRRGSVSAGRPTKRRRRLSAGRGRPPAPGSLFSVGRRPPSQPPLRKAPRAHPSPGADPRLHSLPTRQRRNPRFLSSPGSGGAPHEGPPARRAGLRGSHTSPPGGRSEGLLRLGWSRANGWAPRGPPAAARAAPPRSPLRTHPRRDPSGPQPRSRQGGASRRGCRLPLGRQRERRTKGKNFQGPEARRTRY